MDTEPLFCSRSEWKSGTKGVIPMEIFSICTFKLLWHLLCWRACSKLWMKKWWEEPVSFYEFQDHYLYPLPFFAQLSCSWSHCWWLVWHSGLAAVISWAQVWAVNVWLGEIPQKRDALRDSAFENGLNDVLVARTKGISGWEFQMEVSSTHCRPSSPCWSGKKPGPSIILWQSTPKPRWSNLQTHTYWALCILAGETKVLCYLAVMTEQGPKMLQEWQTVLCTPWSLLLLPDTPGREFPPTLPPGAALQTSPGSCLARKIRAAQPHLGPRGEVFPVRDRITALDTRSPFLWPGCTRSS